MKNKYSVYGAFFFGLFVCVAGCAHLQEAAKEVWGSSIKHLEEARSSGQSKQIALPLDTCFKKTEERLLFEKAVVYLKDRDKEYMAAMNFKGHVDTTEVGIFFTKVSDTETKVEVASMSPQLVDQVAGFLFSALEESAGQTVENKGENK